MAQSGWIRDSDDLSLAMVGLLLEIVQRSRKAHKKKKEKGEGGVGEILKVWD